MRHHVLEKSRQHLLCFRRLAPHRLAEVHVLEHVAPQLLERYEHLARHRDCLVVIRERRRDHVAHHPVDAVGAGLAEDLANRLRDVVVRDDPGADAVIDVVIDVRDDVADTDDVALERQRA